MNNTYDILLKPPSQQSPGEEKTQDAPVLGNQQEKEKEKKEESNLLANPQSRKEKAEKNQTPRLASQPSTIADQQERKTNAIKDDGVPDVITSYLQDVNLKAWQEVIENTETQNSALRLTSAERYAIEDVVNDLRRTYGIKTSMNEMARLGLLVLLHDFQQQKKASLIYAVKKA